MSGSLIIISDKRFPFLMVNVCRLVELIRDTIPVMPRTWREALRSDFAERFNAA
jgi:hypothetical protein